MTSPTSSVAKVAIATNVAVVVAGTAWATGLLRSWTREVGSSDHQQLSEPAEAATTAAPAPKPRPARQGVAPRPVEPVSPPELGRDDFIRSLVSKSDARAIAQKERLGRKSSRRQAQQSKWDAAHQEAGEPVDPRPEEEILAELLAEFEAKPKRSTANKWRKAARRSKKNAAAASA
mmetsp:Transcript_3500/g.8531  ORF Transcript_3500/g.8531 Transcript_3500/m.8531 type:complete len:176 (+) Transcript_3500:59-586(+)